MRTCKFCLQDMHVGGMCALRLLTALPSVRTKLFQFCNPHCEEMRPKMPFITHKGDKEIPKGHAKWIRLA